VTYFNPMLATGERRERAEQLVIAHWPLATMLARSLGKTWPHLREEAESYLVMLLWRAALRWDATRCVRFTTYARVRLNGGIKDLIRRETCVRLTVNGERSATIQRPVMSSCHGLKDLDAVHSRDLEPLDEVIFREELAEAQAAGALGAEA
jgi:DNA-directed RNA polymerase specialized sigma subunit